MNLSTSSLSYDWFLFALRIAFIGLILLFLYQIARVTIREVVRIGTQAPATSVSFAATSSAASPQLEIVDPAQSGLAAGERFFLDPYTTIGRQESNSVVLEDSFVSGQHAEIILDGGQWWLTDLQSRNGTQVNSQRIAGPIRIVAGDIVQFGNVVTRFVA
ncbi:MAG: FHA domain-containing protein [Thermomicrobiales bacterium]